MGCEEVGLGLHAPWPGFVYLFCLFLKMEVGRVGATPSPVALRDNSRRSAGLEPIPLIAKYSFQPSDKSLSASETL